MKFRPNEVPANESTSQGGRSREEGRGGSARLASLRFPSPLIDPDLRISRIRLCASEGEKHFPSITATSALANKRSSDHLRATSAYAPTDDIRWPMSIIVLIASALLSTSDVADTPGERLSLTQAVSKLIPGDRDEILSHESGLRRNNDSSTLPSGYNYCAEVLGIRVYTQAGPISDN